MRSVVSGADVRQPGAHSAGPTHATVCRGRVPGYTRKPLHGDLDVDVSRDRRLLAAAAARLPRSMKRRHAAGAFHESFRRAEHPGPSSRSFGLTFAALFLVLGLLPLARGGDVRVWSLALAGALAAVGLVVPVLLDVPNRLWLRLGRAINRVIGPAVLGLFFYGVLTPLAALLRRAGRDPLKRRRPDDVETYFVDRETSSSASLRNQY